MGASITPPRAIRAQGITIENEPIIKSDGAGSVTQWDNSNQDAGEGIYFVEGGSAGDPLRLGIGVAAPDRHIQINHAGEPDILLTRTAGATSGSLGSIYFGAQDGDKYLCHVGAAQDGAADAGKLEFSTEATGGARTTRMTISSTGVVSIPSGSITVGSLDIGHGANGVDSSVAIGKNALDANASYGTAIRNVAIGEDALGALASNAADGNTAVGYAAGEALVSGLQNVAVGAYTLRAACADNNTAIGTSALTAFTASNATAVGAYAADAATSAGYLTAVGAYALSELTDGTGNTGVGYGALNLLTTGDYNTAVGHAAGQEVYGDYLTEPDSPIFLALRVEK